MVHLQMSGTISLLMRVFGSKLTKEQWITFYMIIHKTKEVLKEPQSIGKAIKWIGKLGGHLDMKQDGELGLKSSLAWLPIAM